MTPETSNPSSSRFEFMKLASVRNAHILMSEQEFLNVTPPFKPHDEDEWNDGDDEW